MTTVPEIADLVERLAHRLDRGAVSLVLLAEPDPGRGGDGGGLGDAHEFEREVAIGDFAGLRRASVHGGSSEECRLGGE